MDKKVNNINVHIKKVEKANVINNRMDKLYIHAINSILQYKSTMYLKGIVETSLSGIQ